MTTRAAFRTILSLLLAVVVLISTLPVSATDLSGSNVILGNVTGVGNVQLRGSSLAQVGTVFSGDRIRTGGKSYAQVTLSNGNRAELFADTEFVVNQSNEATRMGLSSGAIGFAAASKSPLAISAGVYEITPKAGSNGTVGFIGPNSVNINVTSGSVMLRDLKRKQSIVFPSGAQYLVRLNATGPIAESVTTLPTVPQPGAAPPPAPQTPAGQTPSGGGGAKRALIGLVAAGVTITTVVLGTRNDPCDATCATQLANSKAYVASVQAAISAASPSAQATPEVVALQAQISAISAQLQNPNLTPAQVTALVGQIQNLSALISQIQQIKIPSNFKP